MKKYVLYRACDKCIMQCPCYFQIEKSPLLFYLHSVSDFLTVNQPNIKTDSIELD